MTIAEIMLYIWYNLNNILKYILDKECLEKAAEFQLGIF